MQQKDLTPAVLARVRDTFAEQFVPGRGGAEKAAADLLNERAGDLTREEATRLGQLFNSHVKAGQVRQNRFLPAFAGATIQKVTEDLERFNEVVADLWTAPIDTALDMLGRMYADRSMLPGAGSSLPSMLLYVRDPERFGVCINATMRGLAAALGRAPFRADSRASYEEFCRALRQWRDRYGVAPQEATRCWPLCGARRAGSDSQQLWRWSSVTGRFGSSPSYARTTAAHGWRRTGTAIRPSCGSRSSLFSSRSRRGTCASSTRSWTPRSRPGGCPW